jgi:hypothetical protein
MATQDKKVPIQNGGKGGNGGKTNEDMLKMGRNLAKVANQKRGK